MADNTKDLENKLREKLENGEISQEEFDKLYAKFQDLDLLSSRVEDTSRRQSYSFVGSRTHNGGVVDDVIRVSGKFISTSSLECIGMKISGSASIEGDLIVKEATSISGKIDIKDKSQFHGPFKLSGKANMGGDVEFNEIAKVSGKLITDRDIVSNSLLSVSGKVISTNLRSNALVKISGVVDITGDLIADCFETSGGSSVVGGNLKARVIEIARRYRQYSDNYRVSDDLDDLDFEGTEVFPEIARFVSRLVTQVVPNIVHSSLNSFSAPRTFSVGGNIEGETVDISYAKVTGDINADSVLLGPEVEVGGTILTALYCSGFGASKLFSKLQILSSIMRLK